MSDRTTDIDIDFADRDAALRQLVHVPAVLGDGTKHASGVYFQDIPTNPFNRLATLDTKTAAGLGYFKIDLLNNSIYRGVRDEAHLLALMSAEPPWDLFAASVVVGRLHHIHKHFGVVQSIKPGSIDDLAVVIALIRPGKRHLIGRPRGQIDAEIWQPVAGDSYSFKKSHAIAYALSIVVQLNLMLEAMDDMDAMGSNQRL